MTTVKRARQRANSAFADVCRTKASVYLAGLSNGFVKVGFSDNPRTRLGDVNYYSKLKYGANIVCFHVYEGIGTKLRFDAVRRDHSSQARALEARLIKLLADHGRACPPSGEVFEGICFDAAKALADAEIAKLKKSRA